MLFVINYQFARTLYKKSFTNGNFYFNGILNLDLITNAKAKFILQIKILNVKETLDLFCSPIVLMQQMSL
jgi:hypothetical protein